MTVGVNGVGVGRIGGGGGRNDGVNTDAVQGSAHAIGPRAGAAVQGNGRDHAKALAGKWL